MIALQLVRFARALVLACVAITGGSALADAGIGLDGVERQPLNTTAIAMFCVFVAVTLVITVWAARRNRTRDDFYVAGGDLSPFQNGTAIAGEFMSAASFLGFIAAIYASGFDSLVMIVGVMAAWPIMLCLIAEPLRNLGRYSFVDVLTHRLDPRRVRLLASVGSLFVLLFLLIAQTVAAGKLIELLFGLDYIVAVAITSALMLCYVLFGGMLATTWVQIIKAVLLFSGGLLLAGLVLARFGFDLSALMENAGKAHAKGPSILVPSVTGGDPIKTVSLAMSMLFGTLATPHILMRFFTVRDATAARNSVLVTTGFVAIFYLAVIIAGFGAIAILAPPTPYHAADGGLIGGVNMTALHLSHAMAGDLFLGFMTSVAFATILAVVAGVTVTWSATVAHDLYAELLHKGEVDEKREVWVSRISVLGFGVLAVIMGMAFEHQNVAFIGILALSIAASVNFPLLVLSIYWPGFTTRGALAGGLIGLVGSVGLILVGPMVMQSVLGYSEALFPYEQPTVFSMLAAFAGAWFFSVTDKSERGKAERAGFDQQMIEVAGN